MAILATMISVAKIEKVSKMTIVVKVAVVAMQPKLPAWSNWPDCPKSEEPKAAGVVEMANKVITAKVAQLICRAGLSKMAIKAKMTRLTKLAQFAKW